LYSCKTWICHNKFSLHLKISLTLEFSFVDSEFLGDFFGVLFGDRFLPVVKGDRGECNLLPGVPLEFLLLVFPGVGGPGF